MGPMDILQKTLMITAFVSVMMLLIEVINVQTKGVLLGALKGTRWRQYLLAALLGAIPGCLGAYALVALYAHRKVTVGALVVAMITTSGDETFVMLALFPGTTGLLTLGLAMIGVAAGWATDTFLPERFATFGGECDSLEVHETENCHCFQRKKMLTQWRPPSIARLSMSLGLVILIITLASGLIGPQYWGWKRITFLIVMSAGLFVSATVPDHFLEEHLWRHVAKRHVPRIFLWTTGAFIALAILTRFVNVGTLVSSNPWVVLLISGVVGIIPESGPHLIFVTMYAEKLLPLSILVASSVVQDGHGMLPLLSTSRRAFVVVKLINLAVGLVVGGVLLAAGL